MNVEKASDEEEDFDDDIDELEEHDDQDDNVVHDPDWIQTPLFSKNPAFRSTARRKTDLFKQKQVQLNLS